jgi:hypothetical protein
MIKYDEKQVLEWKHRVECWQKSYLSMASWCRENQTTVYKLQYWRDKLNLQEDRYIRNMVLKAYPNALNIYLHTHPINMYMSFEYLKGVIDESFTLTPTGSYFVFLGKRRQTIKVFSFDSSSETIWYNRLNHGTFIFNRVIKSSVKYGNFYVLL